MARDQESYARSGELINNEAIVCDDRSTGIYFYKDVDPIALRTPTVMTNAELADWVKVGKNAVPKIVSRFGIREITKNSKNQKYAVHDIMRKIIGIAPRTDKDLYQLLIPLQKTKWVSEVIGLSVSAINAQICENRSGLPAPVELTVADPRQAAARGRRWIPAHIHAYLRGDPIPFMADIAAQSQVSPPQSSNVFAAICSGKTEVSPDCHL